MTMGGFPKFNRTKRQNMMLNKPISMWEGTHLLTSSEVHKIQNPKNTTQSILLDLDTSFCKQYDEPGVGILKLQGISHEIESTIHRDFDYSYVEEEEGTSYRNFRRKAHFNSMVDHINNPNSYLNEKMTEYFKKSYTRPFHRARDTSLDGASKEFERQQIKFLRLNRQLNSITAYKDELVKKSEFFAKTRRRYPLLRFNEHELHNYTYDEMRRLIAQRIENARIVAAVTRIQRAWRDYVARCSIAGQLLEKNRAAAMIQRNWRATKWVRLMNQLVASRKTRKAATIQKYMKGYKSRKDTVLMLKDSHLYNHLRYFDQMRLDLLTHCQIKIRWAWKLHKRRKAIKKAKAAKKAKGKKKGKKR